MSQRRLHTVYDFSSLQLHADGTRVRQLPSDARPLGHPGTVHLASGRWIARDAGGSGKVKRRVRAKQHDPVSGTYEEEEFDQFSGSEFEFEPGQKGKGRKDNLGRRKSRRKVVEGDVEFLEGSSKDVEAHSERDALPSSDLLKNIHYFASMYYTERGQLFNASRQYRKQKRLRQLGEVEDRSRSLTPEADSDEDVEEDEEEERPKKKRRGGRTKGKKRVYETDMYRVMDGSALMAIGMLVQEYVAHLLEARIPPGWDESMEEEATESATEFGDGEQTERGITTDSDESGSSTDLPDVG